jgi:hypothetical protein
MQVQRGISAVMRGGAGRFMPTLPSFRQLCLDSSQDRASAPARSEESQSPGDLMSAAERAVNLTFLDVARESGGMPEETVQRLLKQKKRLLPTLEQIVADGDPVGARDILNKLKANWLKIARGQA